MTLTVGLRIVAIRGNASAKRYSFPYMTLHPTSICHRTSGKAAENPKFWITKVHMRSRDTLILESLGSTFLFFPQPRESDSLVLCNRLALDA